MYLVPSAMCMCQRKNVRNGTKKGKHGIIVGYSDHMDGFRVWHKSENCIVRSKDDVFGQEITEKLLFPGETSDNARAEEQKSVPDLVQSSSESSS